MKNAANRKNFSDFPDRENYQPFGVGAPDVLREPFFRVRAGYAEQSVLDNAE
jgi:hypothetical protein